jgi:hypothetical protein
MYDSKFKMLQSYQLLPLMSTSVLRDVKTPHNELSTATFIYVLKTHYF